MVLAADLGPVEKQTRRKMELQQGEAEAKLVVSVLVVLGVPG